MPLVGYEPGEVLPGSVYRVIRHLATGGMGTVYEVEDTTVEKRYVLKTLHPQLVSREDLARRMRDEARSLAKLHHPNIVEVITAGVTSDHMKMPFYVMERLVGQNLRVVLQKKKVLDVATAFRIAIDVLDALEHAHAHAIVHRDVKPENIFLHRSASGMTTTKLLDFGIVRLLDRNASQTKGNFIGTPRYASPEQITGGAIGPPSDIYSLACVLYEMLAGRGAFDDAGDAYAVCAAHAQQPPPPLSRFVRVAPEIDRLVTRALSKDPGSRPRSCSAFANDLRNILRSEEAAPGSATEVDVLSMTPPTDQDPNPPQFDVAEDFETSPVTPVAPTVTAETARPELHGVRAVRAVDREAPTRASAPVGATVRLPSNDTQMEHRELPKPKGGRPPVLSSASAPPVRPSSMEVPAPAPKRSPVLLVVAGAVVMSVTLVGGALALSRCVRNSDKLGRTGVVAGEGDMKR
jgi:serine/threonine-protein kinase